MKKFMKKLGGALSGRTSQSAYLVAAVIAVAVVFNVLIWALTSALGLYIYSDEGDDLSLSGTTDVLFEDTRGKEITVTFCMTEEEMKKHETGSFVYKTAKGFEQRYPELVKLKYVNIITGRDENGERFSFDKYTKDMKGNETPLRSSSVIFTSGLNYRVLTDVYTQVGFADFYTLDSEGRAFSYNGEEVMASMMAWVLNDEHKVAYFTQGHGETADVSMSNLLSCAGYYVDVINLREEEVPSDAGLVIVSNPVSDFERGASGSGISAELERLGDYVEGGGRLYVSIDPYTRELKEFHAFLAEYGITVSGSTDEDGVYSRDLVKDDNMAISTDGLAFISRLGDGDVASAIREKIEKYGTGSVVVSDVSRLTLSRGAEAILLSSDSAECITAGKVTDTQGNYCVGAVSTVKNEEEGTEGRVFVVSGIFLTSGDLLVAEGYSNSDFVYALLREVMGANNATYGCNRVVYDTGTLQNLTMGTARIWFALLIAIPVVIAVAGAIIIIRRKNR